MKRCNGWVVVMLFMLVACGDDTTTPPAEVPTAADLQARGSYDVGYRELELTYAGAVDGVDRVLPLRVWYPATNGGEAKATYAVAGIVEVPAGGALDAPAIADGESFPLAIYSHGFSGEGLLAYPYGEHFASHGWIVIGPNHTGNTALDSVNMTVDTQPRITINRPWDITAIIDWAESELPGDLAGKARTDAVFMFGHSYGGYTTFAAGGIDLDYDTFAAGCTTNCDPFTEAGVQAAIDAGFGDDRIVAIAPQAPAVVPAYKPGELAGLNVPTMLMSARKDITLLDEVMAKPAWAGLDNPDDIWVEIPEGGHLSFISICDDLEEGLLALFQPNFATDGCGASNPPVAETVPVLSAYLLGFARQHVLGEDWSAVLTGEPFHPAFVVSTH